MISLITSILQRTARQRTPLSSILTRVHKPNRIPRPDLARLGIHYRRIPLLAIGRDIYCDTRLILRKLDVLFPASEEHPGLAPTSDSDAGLAALFENWTIDGGVLRAAVGLLPPTFSMFQDAEFLTDRAELMDIPKFDPEAMVKNRPQALAQFEQAFALLEETVLADGREWVCGGDGGITVADLHAIWPLDWFIYDPLLADALSASEKSQLELRYPKTFAWLARFQAKLSNVGAWVAETSAPPQGISGDDAVGAILNAQFAENRVGVDIDQAAALDVAAGRAVEVWPTDYGAAHHDRGTLIVLNVHEVAINVKAEGNMTVKVHFPRTNFAIKKVE